MSTTTLYMGSEESRLRRVQYERMWEELVILRATYPINFDRYFRATEAYVMQNLGIVRKESRHTTQEGLIEVCIVDDGEKCSVCFEDIKIGDVAKAIKGCSHTFCARCITEWLTRKPTCPLCRFNTDPNGDQIEEGFKIEFYHFIVNFAGLIGIPSYRI
ncbi:hypothetical protein GIB67_043174 [Kingdonia uniflora]|uniref:RING-type domain-containing protein n=1 Tax=Kingdonia uniflora TaxID=39325 RepID=A0A7J7NJN8_9MAGN|nr:hypothetical protein GIB67_043174 [Kingdonia uniflora]